MSTVPSLFASSSSNMLRARSVQLVSSASSSRISSSACCLATAAWRMDASARSSWSDDVGAEGSSPAAVSARRLLARDTLSPTSEPGRAASSAAVLPPGSVSRSRAACRLLWTRATWQSARSVRAFAAVLEGTARPRTAVLEGTDRDRRKTKAEENITKLIFYFFRETSLDFRILSCPLAPGMCV